MDSATTTFSPNAKFAFEEGLRHMILDRVQKDLSKKGHDEAFIASFIETNREKIDTCINELYENMDVECMVTDFRMDYVPYPHPENDEDDEDEEDEDH